MKISTLLLATSLLFSLNTQAASSHDMFESVRAEVDGYYAATGEWSLVRLKNIQEVETDSREFVLWKASAHIQNDRTTRGKIETCLVIYIADNSELYGINCF